MLAHCQVLNRYYGVKGQRWEERICWKGVKKKEMKKKKVEHKCYLLYSSLMDQSL